jgi:hypothetical protein
MVDASGPQALAQATVVALTASFFVGGQELRRLFGGCAVGADDSVTYATDEVVFGTGRTQLVFIARAFFLLIGIEALVRVLLGTVHDTALGRRYPVIA